MQRFVVMRKAWPGLLFALMLPAALPAGAQTPIVVPGKSVGQIFLGMKRADVWNAVQKPATSAAIRHGSEIYAEDTWDSKTHQDRQLTVVSLRDRVIQIEFNNPQFATGDGLSPASSMARIRRRYPRMDVRLYSLEYDENHGSEGFYIDDIPAGIAFTVETQEAVGPSYLNSAPYTLIVHRKGRRAVPVYAGHWSALAAPNEDPDSLRVVRSWFTPETHH